MWFLREPIAKLQEESSDITYAFKCVKTVISEIEIMRININIFAERIYKHASILAEKSNIKPVAPRVHTGQQSHQANPLFETVEECFKRSLITPFIDHVLVKLKDELKSSDTIELLHSFVPSIICVKT